jgi:hypothetical protein
MRRPQHPLSHWIVGGLGAAALAANLVSMVPYIRRTLGFVGAGRHLGMGQRLELRWGDAYRLALMVREAAPRSSTVLIPSRLPDLESVWPDVGNETVMRSFLYPRRVLPLTDADWRERAKRPPEPNVYAFVVSKEVNGRAYVSPPREAIAGWHVRLLPSGWGIAASPGSPR